MISDIDFSILSMRDEDEWIRLRCREMHQEETTQLPEMAGVERDSKGVPYSADNPDLR